ncbi:MAG: glucosaminidase domain-containing protein [Clostridiales bacterium]|nr:glucosaminidase domain-containing protein [Clostridiales bacterium]
MKKEKNYDYIITGSVAAMAVVILAIIGLVAFICVVGAVTAEGTTFPLITEPCGLTEEELDERLKGELKGYAGAFLQAEEDYEINACFLVSVAALESGWGRSKVAENKNNLFGWTRTGGGYKEFDSFEHCIDWCAWKIRKKYINNGLDTIAEIAPVYCDREWGEKVKEIYIKLYENWTN